MWSLVILVSPLPQQVMQTVLITEGHSKTPMSAEWKFMCATNIHGVSDMCQIPAWVLNAQQRTNPMKALVSCQWGRQTSKSTQINVWDVAGGGKCSESKYSRIKTRVTVEGSTQWHYSLLDEGGQLPAKAEWNGQRAMQTTRGCRGWSSWPCISQASQGPHPFVTSMLLLLPARGGIYVRLHLGLPLVRTSHTCSPAFIYPLGSLRPSWCKEVQASLLETKVPQQLDTSVRSPRTIRGLQLRGWSQVRGAEELLRCHSTKTQENINQCCYTALCF